MCLGKNRLCPYKNLEKTVGMLVFVFLQVLYFYPKVCLGLTRKKELKRWLPASRPRPHYLFVEGPQLPILPQCVEHLGRCFHHLGGVAACTSTHTHTSVTHHSIEVAARRRRGPHPLPRPLLMSTSLWMPPLSASALAFSRLRPVTSCRVQQTDATVSSDSGEGLPPPPPPPLLSGSRFTRSRIAYLPSGTGERHRTELTGAGVAVQRVCVCEINISKQVL